MDDFMPTHLQPAQTYSIAMATCIMPYQMFCSVPTIETEHTASYKTQTELRVAPSTCMLRNIATVSPKLLLPSPNVKKS